MSYKNHKNCETYKRQAAFARKKFDEAFETGRIDHLNQSELSWYNQVLDCLDSPTCVAHHEAPAKPEPASVRKPSVKSAPNPKNGPSTLPRTGLDTEPATDQNKHLWRIMNHKSLSKEAKHMGMVANACVGGEAKKQGGFAKVVKSLAAKRLAELSGWSENKCREAMAELVKAGLFYREDFAKGGKPGEDSCAKYRATIPIYA